MNRTYLLALFLSLGLIASAQTVVLPYNPDVEPDGEIGIMEIMETLAIYGAPFSPGEVLVNGQALSEYISALEEAAANATSDTIIIPLLPGTTPGEMLYWDGFQWSLIPPGDEGEGLIVSGGQPIWKDLTTGCRDSSFLEYDPSATVNDGSCLNLKVFGCTDPDYSEFNPSANVDDGSCEGYLCQNLEFDGYNYPLVWIGDQCWFAEDLRSTVYRNGDLIPSGLDDAQWSTTVWGASAIYGEGSSSCNDFSPDINPCDDVQSLATYGRLYNWFAVNDARGLCPFGWHVPTYSDFDILHTFVTSEGFSGIEGTALKSTDGWHGLSGTDNFGFKGLPGGFRLSEGQFQNAGRYSHYWSATSQSDGAWTRRLYDGIEIFGGGYNDLNLGAEVRCLRDIEVQGCTDPAYIEYDSTATADDGSCLTLVVFGCTDAAYSEYNAAANTDDGSCATLTSTCNDVEMNGHSYAVVEIGDQCWFAENLRTTVYRNGDVIPAGLTDGEWTSTTFGATAVYGEGSSGCDNFSPDIDACDEGQSLTEHGRLYNWLAVDDARGLCPTGWHVPTEGEWTELEDFITSQGFAGTEGAALKSTTGWYDNGNGMDDFGFSALPAGRRFYDNGNFTNAGDVGYWWSSSPDGGNARRRILSSINPDILWGWGNPRSGFSVRCLRDADIPEAQGCTDPNYIEYDSTATADNGSCLTLVVFGCTDAAYSEYNAGANTDDGSCATLLSTCIEVEMDGHFYGVVEIGDQCWFAENLRTTVYSNGDSIPAGLTDNEWTSTTAGATAVYGEGNSNCSNYSPDIDACDETQALTDFGRLYNWFAVDDARGLCPGGWHVPSDSEWTQLELYVGSNGHSTTESTALKSTSGWYNNGNGTDDFEFSALPGGIRFDGGGNFHVAGDRGYWWSSSLCGVAWLRVLESSSSGILRGNYSQRGGLSVRCLRDAE